jgi:hypothetical protein
MAWIVPTDFSTGRLVTAVDWNVELGTTGNMSMTVPAIVLAAGDLAYATGPHAIARLPVGAEGALLAVAAGLPAWSTGPLALAAGSAAAPTYSFSGRTDTGVYSPAAQTLALATGGTERVRVDGAGNVGVGTTTPAQLVHASSTATHARFQAQTTAAGKVAGLLLSANGVDWEIQHRGSLNSPNNRLAVFYSGTERWFLDAGGGLLAATDNAYDIGSGGQNRPRHVYIAGTYFAAGNIQIDGGWTGDCFPATDNMYTCGKGANRWVALYAANGIIQTSDPATKDVERSVPPEELLAVALRTNLYAYRHKELDEAGAERRIDPKDDRRWRHVGVMAPEADALISPDHRNVNPQTTASIALGAVRGAYEALKAEIDAIRAELATRRN